MLNVFNNAMSTENNIRYPPRRIELCLKGCWEPPVQGTGKEYMSTALIAASMGSMPSSISTRCRPKRKASKLNILSVCFRCVYRSLQINIGSLNLCSQVVEPCGKQCRQNGQTSLLLVQLRKTLLSQLCYLAKNSSFNVLESLHILNRPVSQTKPDPLQAAS